MKLVQKVETLNLYREPFLFTDASMKKIEVFMGIASQLSELSTCSRLAVGAVIVDNRYRVIGMGYNGSPKGMPHCSEVNPEGAKEKCSCIHAEQNAVVNAGFLTDSSKLAFVSTSPCGECMKLLSSFGVTDVIYLTPYRDVETGLQVARDHRINVYQLV